MLARLLDLPLLVITIGIAGAAMYLPAIHALVLRDYPVGRAFFYSGTLVLVLTGLIGLALANRSARNVARSHFAALIGAYLVLPPILSLPFAEAVRDASRLDAWFEMVSAFTTTGASLYAPEALPAPVHLWRALCGWFGGLFVLIGAATILAPMNLGGFELLAEPAQRQPGVDQPDPAERLRGYALRVAPAYGGITVALWIVLVIAGEAPFVALCHAMGAVSTSGISPVGGVEGGAAAGWSEGAIALVCALALTRRSLPGAVRIDPDAPLWRDPELRLAAAIIGGVSVLLFARHALGALWGEGDAGGPAEALAALWGMIFTTVSFLTTTGYVSAGWTGASAWSGVEAPVMVLLGLAIIGGGVATTAGGVRLLRVHALGRMGARELDRLSHPSAVGRGDEARQARRAPLAFVVFMLFALALGTSCAALALTGLDFDRSVVLAVAALATAGQLADLAQPEAGGFAALGAAGKAVAAGTMIAGRLETLAILAVLMPGGWSRWGRR
ncbi:MAG: potassium transporter TrkG [Gemmobacter sp.]|jgi:trk system potassium uptake protein TrkH